MKTPKIHEVYKGYEIELFRGKPDQKDSWAHAQGKEAHVMTTRYVTPREAVEAVKAMIDSRVENA